MKKPLLHMPRIEKWPEWIILLIFFCYSLLVGLIIQFILLPYVFPSWHAGEGLLVGLDSRAFHRQAAELANKILAEGWSAWKITSQPVAGIAAIFYVLVAPHPWVLLPLNSFLHAIAAWMLYKILNFFLDQRIHAILSSLPLLLFPSALSWVTQMHNDNYSVTGAILVLYAWVCFSKKDSWQNYRLILGGFISLIGGVCLTWLVRDYVVSMYTGVGGIVFLICLIMYFSWWQRSDWSWKRTLIACMVTSIGFFTITFFHIFDLGASTLPTDQVIGQVRQETSTMIIPSSPESIQLSDLEPGDPGFKPYMLWQDSSWLPSWIDNQLEQLSIKRFKAIRSTWTDTRGGSNIDTDIFFRNAFDIIQYLPRAAEIGLLSPFPTDWFDRGSKAPNTMMRRVSAFEMVVTYLAWIGIIVAVWTWRKRTEFWVLFIFCLGMVVIYALGTPNVGTLYRLRYPFFMTLVGFGIAGWILAIVRTRAFIKP